MTRASPAWLAELPPVEMLRQVLLQNYTRTVHADGREVVRRREKAPEGDGLPPGHTGSPPPMTPTPGGAPSGTSSGWDTSCT